MAVRLLSRTGDRSRGPVLPQLEPYHALAGQVATARNLDVRHVSFPVPDLGVVDDGRCDEVLQAILDGLGRGGVYVHCWGGLGRTATVVGCVLADGGLAYDEIVVHLDTLRQGTRKAHRRAPETRVQHELIRRRVERRR